LFTKNSYVSKILNDMWLLISCAMYNAAVFCVRVRKQQQVAGAVTSLAMKGQQACRLVSRSFSFLGCIRWLGSRVVSVLDSGAEGPGSNRSRDAFR